MGTKATLKRPIEATWLEWVTPEDDGDGDNDECLDVGPDDDEDDDNE